MNYVDQFHSSIHSHIMEIILYILNTYVCNMYHHGHCNSDYITSISNSPSIIKQNLKLTSVNRLVPLYSLSNTLLNKTLKKRIINKSLKLESKKK